MKLYTRSGDDGSTGLFGGGRVAKDDPRVDAYGIIDELNAYLGLCATECREDGPAEAQVSLTIQTIQTRLLEIGADLATPYGTPHESKISRLPEEAVDALERLIDEIDGANPPLTGFILPGGSELASRIHVARTICRRAERATVGLARDIKLNNHIIVYLNRLSDLLFALARYANVIRGTEDISWTSP